MLVPPEVFGISACCAGSPHSKYTAVTGVQLSRLNDGTLQAVASDGRVLVATTWRELKRTAKKGRELVIRCEDWEAATKRKGRKKMPPLFVDERKGKTAVGPADQPDKHTKVVPLDGSYPPWEEYIPTYRPSESVSVTLDIASLNKLLTVLKPLSDDGEGYYPVKLTISNTPMRMMLLTCESAETKTRAAIMPLNME